MRAVLSVIALAALILLAAPRPALAGTRVFVGGAIGVPPYSYYYPYGYPFPHPVYPVFAYPPYPASVPPGWDPGHWERRYDASGRAVDVWVPQHLR